MNLLIDNSGQANLLTFAGSAVNGPISRALAQRNINIKKFDNFSVVIANKDVAKISRLLGDLIPTDCEPTVPHNLGNALKFSTCLPPGQAAAILSERFRDERGLVETLKRPVRVVRAADG